MYDCTTFIIVCWSDQRYFINTFFVLFPACACVTHYIHAIQTIQVNYIVHIVYVVVYVYKSKKGYLDISEAIDYKQFITVAK